jgi:hypothetical protein
MIKINIMKTEYTEEQKYLRAKKKVKSIKGFYVHLMLYLLVNAFLLIVRVFSDGGTDALWDWQSYNTILFWGIGLAFHAFGVFGMDIIFGKNWEDQKIKEFMEKDKREFWE